jgi:hypothetical protein
MSASGTTFIPGSGNQTIIGAGGADTTVFLAPHTQYTITVAGAWVRVSNNAGTSGTDLLYNIDNLQFTDGVITLAHPASEAIDATGFDVRFYESKYADIAAAVKADPKFDPLAHYLNFGWKEGRDPNAFFNTTYYLTANPDVAAAGVNPLLQYDGSGWKEGRNPSASFNGVAYLAANPDVAAAGINPMQHYLTSGLAESRVVAPVTLAAAASKSL